MLPWVQRRYRSYRLAGGLYVAIAVVTLPALHLLLGVFPARVVTPAVYPKPRRLADPARLARTPAGRGGAEARDSLHHDMARARALRAFMATNDRRIDEPGSR